MFGINKKVQTGATVTLKINGMHCVSCAMNIDGALEDFDGVQSSETNYAKGITTIVYNGHTLSVEKFKDVITQLGYSVS